MARPPGRRTIETYSSGFGGRTSTVIQIAQGATRTSSGPLVPANISRAGQCASAGVL